MSGSFYVVLLIILVLVAFWRVALMLVLALALAIVIVGVGTIGGILSPSSATPAITAPGSPPGTGAGGLLVPPPR